jgi:hypothetical protein
MIGSRCFLLAGVALTFCLALPLAAQEEKGRRRGGQGAPGGFGGGLGMFAPEVNKLALLRIEAVQKEVKLEEEQAKKVADLQASLPERGGLRGQGEPSREEREKRFAEMREKRAKAVAEAEAKLASILKPEQIKRLDEIVLQQQGIDGLVTEPVAASLKLSKEQKEKIQAALDARAEALRGLRPGQGGGREELREKMDEARKKAEETALAVLASEQREAYEKLKGKPFPLDRRALFGGQGGAGREGPGGRGGQGGGGPKQRPPADEV